MSLTAALFIGCAFGYAANAGFSVSRKKYGWATFQALASLGFFMLVAR